MQVVRYEGFARDCALSPDGNNAFVIFNVGGRDDLAFINLKKQRIELQPLRMAGDILGGLKRMQAGQNGPALTLNDHCRECEFRNRCHAEATAKDDLSLLRYPRSWLVAFR